ncbi:MAG: hypothetical protein QT12_C0008G0002 [archaeon GW2011_AR21]|nr:MAG: hypothetical protein QT12_C0008G0002 [archaeon GW2011_AR21]
MDPEVSDGKIVWSEDRYGYGRENYNDPAAAFSDIFVYDINIYDPYKMDNAWIPLDHNAMDYPLDTRLTTYWDQGWPAIDKNKIVWGDDRNANTPRGNSNVYMHDLTTRAMETFT